MASRRTIAFRAALPILLVGGLLLLTGEWPRSSTEPSRPEGGPGAATGPAPVPGGTGAPTGCVIEGLVLRRGRGVEARVEARVADWLDRGPVAGATAAGADGRFRMEGLPAGRYEVRAVAKSRAVGEAVAEVAVPGARVRVRIDIPAGRFSLSARAVWADGRPFRGLVRGTAWTETGPDGRFRIRGLDRGVHPLVFLLPGVFRSVGHAVAVPADRDFVFVVDEGAVVLAGRVVDSDGGAPIADVLVGSTGGRRAQFAVTVRHRVRTDEEGRFRVRVVPMTYRGLSLKAEGYRPCRYNRLWSAKEVETSPEIRLERAHRATGRVVTVEGRPVAGVSVFAEPAGWNYHGAPAPARAVSGDEGKFVLEGISGEDVIVFARGGGFVSTGLAASLGGSRNPLRRTLGRETSAGIRVVVVPSSAIEGRVVDPNGRPIAGALVRGLPPVKGADFEIPMGNLRCRTATGPDGRFRLADLLPDAAYDLRVTAPGHLPVTARVPPVPSGETAEAEIVAPLGRSLAALAGTRETVDPEPAPGLAIGGRILLADGTPVPHGRMTTGRRHSSPIGAGGAFLVPGHAPGRYRVEAEALVDDRRHVGVVEAEAGDVEVEIVLVPEPEKERHGPGFEVRILDPEGRPVPWAELVCVDLGDLSNYYGWSGNLVHLGRTRIDLDAGGKRFWLLVRDARSHSNAPLPVGPVLVGPIEAGEAKIEIRLPPEREIRGIVLDEHGRAVPGARVYCVELRSMGSAFEGRGSSVYTDDEGRFRIGRLGDGDHRLSASLGDLGPAVAIVRAGAGDALLVLKRSVSAIVRVLDAGGRAVSGVPVEVRGGPGEGTVRTDARGRARFTGLRPDPRYALVVPPEASIDPWTPRDTTIRRPELLRVEGRAVDAVGEPAGDVAVWCLPAGGRWRDTTAGDDGSFSFAGLPPGPVRLLALPDEVSPVAADARAVTVPAGAKGVRLVYRPGTVMRFLIRGWPEKDPDCEARLVAASGETTGGLEWFGDGTFEFIGLDERAVYSLWISPLEDGRTLYLTGFRPGPNRVAVSLEKGGVIRGVLVRRVRVEEVEIRLEGPGFTLDSVQFPDGRFQITGVPSGTFTVVAEGRLDGKPIRATVRAGGGESVELILGEEKDD